tara:strand:- start:794 stop:1780 length:987 start_codon:yes stop_codon:yes gene_type:complete
MLKNTFFNNKGPFKIDKLLLLAGLPNPKKYKKIKIFDVREISVANGKEITFFNSIKYKVHATKTKAAFCVTTQNLKIFLPKNCHPIIAENVLLTVAKITKIFYPDSINDNFDKNLKLIEKTSFKKKVDYGKNVLIGKNVKIGKNVLIGSNTIIESNVIIDNNCSIGSNVILRKSIIKNNVKILDGCIIGKKGFGFFPDKKNNFRYPHIGCVIIDEYSEIGCGSTIDRGSISNTIIGKNTFLDNQVHIAHNVKIGNNCIIAGQVGFAGSTTVGNYVMIGGQAGISGHLKIGNNVHIGGGSGVIKDIPDNSKVMGYPAKDLKEFIKENKK